ncbi:MAG: type 1 glutamine amidotransferase domain-containing protein [Thermoplasmatota archaeon]
MSNIAVIIDDMYEDVEYEDPVDAYRNAGHRVTNIGLEKGRSLKGKRGNSETKVEESVEEASPDDFDALFIPGGYSPDKLRAHEGPVKFVEEFVKSGKPVFLICHGAQLLITADVLRDREVTGWRSIHQDIKNAGADLKDQEVVVDVNLISSRHPSDIPAFIDATISMLKDRT